MLTSSHLLSSIFILYLLSIIAPHTFPFTMPLAVLSMILANLPDIDSLWSRNLRIHHQSPFHAPLFWIIVSVLGLIISKLTYYIPLWLVVLLFAQTMLHLFFDYITARTCGVPLFYPFSKKEYSLCTLIEFEGELKPLFPKLNEVISFTKFYLQNKKLVIIEIMVCAGGIAAILK